MSENKIDKCSHCEWVMVCDILDWDEACQCAGQYKTREIAEQIYAVKKGWAEL